MVFITIQFKGKECVKSAVSQCRKVLFYVKRSIEIMTLVRQFAIYSIQYKIASVICDIQFTLKC